MRTTLLLCGLLCSLFGAQLLIVDKVVLHQFSARSATVDESAESDVAPQQEPRVIDLPDSGGFVLVAVGAACLMYWMASRKQKERRAP